MTLINDKLKLLSCSDLRTFLKKLIKDKIETEWTDHFIDNMNFAYTASDLVISRAGAIAIAEICLLKKASILIPSPYVSENHQYENAKSLQGQAATCLINQNSLNIEFWDKLNHIMSNKNYRENISVNAYALSKKNAENIIFKSIIDLI